MHEYRRTVMPSVYSQADADWIQEQLGRLPPSARQKAVTRYAEVYQATYDDEPVSYRKENRARHEANVRLRNFVGKHYRPLQGYTEQPPSLGQK
jgi:hypothetical protein